MRTTEGAVNADYADRADCAEDGDEFGRESGYEKVTMRLRPGPSAE